MSMRRLLLFRPADGSKERPVVEEKGRNRGENARERARHSPREPIKGSFDAFLEPLKTVSKNSKS